MKDSLTVIIVLLILIILADGIRRMRLARRDKIRMSRNVYKQSGREEPSQDNYTSELPNGGARIVGYREPTPVPVNKPFPRKPPEHKPAEKKPADSRKPEQTSLNLDESVPMLMESVPEESSTRRAVAGGSGIQSALNRSFSKLQAGLDLRADEQLERIEPTLSVDEGRNGQSAYADDSTGDGDQPLEDDYDDNDDDHPDDYQEDDYDDGEDDEYQEEDYPEHDYHQDAEERYEDPDDDEPESYAPPAQPAAQAAASPSARQRHEPEEVLIVNVMSRHEFFQGEALLDILLACGLRFGDMNIFHRHSDGKGGGELLFSLANIVKPGTFDLDTMDEFSTPGVSLFMTLPLKADSLQSFELMLDAARRIAEGLNGELKDENRSVMTRQTIEHCRERIREFERRRRLSH